MEHMCVAMQSHKKTIFFLALRGNQKYQACSMHSCKFHRVQSETIYIQLELDLTAGEYEGGGSWSGCIMAGSES